MPHAIKDESIWIVGAVVGSLILYVVMVQMTGEKKVASGDEPSA
jgi:hypothetical protein